MCVLPRAGLKGVLCFVQAHEEHAKVPQEPGTSRTRPHGWDCQGTQSRPQACPRQGRRLQAGKGSVGLHALLQGLWGAMLVG